MQDFQNPKDQRVLAEPSQLQYAEITLGVDKTFIALSHDS